MTSDGSHTLMANEAGLSYHSIFGAISESQCVFLDAGLAPILEKQKKARILETGFGTGLNAFMTLLEAEKQQATVSYTTLELFPIDLHLAQKLNFADQLQQTTAQDLFLQLHRCAWDTPIQLSEFFLFEKKKQDIESFFAENAFDIIYFDAFSPTDQPELWSQSVFERYYKALSPAGVLVSYCAKGSFKRALKAAGFIVENLPGPPRKRAMTRATKPQKTS